MANDLTIYDQAGHAELTARIRAIEELRSGDIFREGVHYGEPFKGSGKPTLLKPGAETIMSRFHLWPEFIERSTVERWDVDTPVFHYRYECRLIHRETGQVWGAGIGSCNSLEDKYRWRKQDRTCPSCGESRIIKSKYPDRQTGEIGWYCMGCKSSFVPNDPSITEQPMGRVPNDDVFTLVNTIDKMSQKRALVAAVLVATGASAYFTQDVEDFPQYTGTIIDGETGEVINAPNTPPDAPRDRRIDTRKTSQRKGGTSNAPATQPQHASDRRIDTTATGPGVPVAWHSDVARIEKFVDAAEDYWRENGIGVKSRQHAINRINKALGLQGTVGGNFDTLVEFVQAQYTGSTEDAWKAIQLYESDTLQPAAGE